MTFETPNLYQLVAGDIDLTFWPTGRGGPHIVGGVAPQTPLLSYKRGDRMPQLITGADLKVEPSPLGTQVNAVLEREGGLITRLLLLIPPVLVEANRSVELETMAVLATERATRTAPSAGQSMTFQELRLTGTAARVPQPYDRPLKDNL